MRIKFLIIITLSILFISCQNDKKQTHPSSLNKNLDTSLSFSSLDTFSPPKEKFKLSQKTNGTFSDSIDREKYYGFDTITIKKYISDNENVIKLTGSKSGAPYSVSVKAKNGNFRTYQFADTWYIASHTRIQWDNENFILLSYECGTACYNALAIPIKDNSSPLDYPNFIYSDSTSNTILHIKKNEIIGTNLLTQKQKRIKIDWCIDTPLFESIKYVDLDSSTGELVVIYYQSNCIGEGKDFFNIKEIIN